MARSVSLCPSEIESMTELLTKAHAVTGNTRKCTRCNTHKPLTTQFFYVHRSHSSGFQHTCKACKKAYSSERRAKRTPEQIEAAEKRKRLAAIRRDKSADMEKRKAKAQQKISDAKAAALEAERIRQSDVRLALWVDYTQARANLAEFACTHPEGVSYRPLYADALDFELALRRSEGKLLWDHCEITGDRELPEPSPIAEAMADAFGSTPVAQSNDINLDEVLEKHALECRIGYLQARIFGCGGYFDGAVDETAFEW